MKKLTVRFIHILLAFVVALPLYSGAPVETKESFSYSKPAMPELPEVTEQMDFFKDGYEIVTLYSIADGDTATFNLKSGKYTSRFLAIDTPETSNGIDPWGLKAKELTAKLLTEADVIVLERDPILDGNRGAQDSTFDKYNRLLAHIWVDGELLQYKLIEESLAKTAYFYFDYKYNTLLTELENYVRKVDNRRIFNESDLDPDYDYANKVHDVEIEDLDDSYIGKRVRVSGIVTGRIGNDCYIQSKKGNDALFIYSKSKNYGKLFSIGNEIEVLGRYIIYNGIPEIGSLESTPNLISTKNSISPITGNLSLVSNENISKLVRIENATVSEINGRNITVIDGDLTATIYIDYSTKINAAELLDKGKTYAITGNVSIYDGKCQLMVRSPEDIAEI